MPEISVVIPIFNEALNLEALHRELTAALEPWGRSYEVLLIDDGSTDGTAEVLERLQHQDSRLRIIRFRRNFGQTAAFSAGFAYARAPIIVTSDGDLQNDPRDIAMLVERLEREDASEGWIIDGFPRDLEQAQVLNAELGGRGVDLVIALEVERADIIERIVGRRVCPRGHVYHLTHNPPETPGVCDIDGEALVQRDDDTEEVIVHRIEVYDDESGALLDFYDSKGVLRKVDASGPPDDTYARIHAMVNSS